jgi:F-type H+-transporting ATPase subunit alpha
MPVEEQVVSIYSGTGGFLDDIPVEDVRRFERELLDYVRGRHSDVLDGIRTTGDVPEGDALKEIINSFKQTFQATQQEEQQEGEAG